MPCFWEKYRYILLKPNGKIQNSAACLNFKVTAERKMGLPARRSFCGKRRNGSDSKKNARYCPLQASNQATMSKRSPHQPNQEQGKVARMSEQEIVAKRMTGGKEDDRTKKGGKEGDSFQIRSTNGDTINGPTTVSCTCKSCR